MPSFVLQELLLRQSGSSSLTLQHSSSNGLGQRIKVRTEAETAAHSSSYHRGYQSGSRPRPPPHAISATELNVSYGISCLSRSTSVTEIFLKKLTYGAAINATQQEFSENSRLLSQTRPDADASGVLGNQLEVYRMLSESAGGFILHFPSVQDPWFAAQTSPHIF